MGAAGGKWGCFRRLREWGEEETDGLTVQIPHLSHLNAFLHPWGPPQRGWRQRDKGSQFTRVPGLPGVMGLAQGWRRPLVAEGCASRHPEPRPSQPLQALSRFHIERLKDNFQKRV